MMFVGREHELNALQALFEKPMPSLVTCRGRRRIGKSTLIEVFARQSKSRMLQLEGIAPQKGMTNADQLKAFCRQLGEQAGCRSLKADSERMSRTRLRRRFAGCRCARAFPFARPWSISANSTPWLRAMPISMP